MHVAHDVPAWLAGGLEGIEYGVARHPPTIASGRPGGLYSSPRRSKLYKAHVSALDRQRREFIRPSKSVRENAF
jgi:hypothetical protein